MPPQLLLSMSRGLRMQGTVAHIDPTYIVGAESGSSR